MKIGVTGPEGYIATELLKRDDVIPIHANILHKRALNKEVSNLDIVVHAAALVSSKKCRARSLAALKSNVEGTFSVATACNKNGVRLVYLGTTASYRPDDIITERTPIEPTTWYGQTKAWGGKIVRRFANDSLIFRLCHVYGANDRVSNVNKVIRGSKKGNNANTVRLKAQESALKDYLYIDDAVDAIMIAAERKLDGVYNVSAMRPRSLAQIVDLIGEYVELPDVEYAGGYMGSHVVTSFKFRAETDWKPSITLEEGIEKCIDEVRK